MSGRPAPGTVLDNGDTCTAVVIELDWTDADVQEALSDLELEPDVFPLAREVWHRHSAEQLREAGHHAHDEWWSEEGALKASILVAVLP